MAKDTTKIPFTPYQKFAIFILAITQFTIILDFMIMSPLGDMLMKSMELSPKQFGVAVAAYAFSAGISGLLTAGFADRFDRKKLLLFFYIGFIGGTIFCGIANTYFLLITARIIAGLFGGVIGSISLAIIADLFDIHHRGRVLGFVHMGFAASQVLGIPIGMAIADRWGWQAPFLMVAGVSVIFAILIMVKMQPITAHLSIQRDKKAITHLAHTVAKRNYRIGFLTTALLSMGGFFIMPFGSSFAVNNLHVSQGDLKILFMVAGISSLFIMPIVGRLSDKIDKFAIFAVASVWMMIAVWVYTNLGPTPFWLVICLNIVMMMGIMSRMVPATALITGIPDMADRGAFMSINSSLQQVAGGIAATVGGKILVQKTKTSPLEHFDTLGYLVIIFAIVCVVMLYRVSNVIKKKTAEVKI